MAPSADEKLLSRCGIYCGACYIYRAQRDGGEFLDHVAAWQKAPREKVRCHGCLGPLDVLWQNCRKCVVRSCLEANGYGFCHECPVFEDRSCEKYERLSRFCAERGRRQIKGLGGSSALPRGVAQDIPDIQYLQCARPAGRLEGGA